MYISIDVLHVLILHGPWLKTLTEILGSIKYLRTVIIINKLNQGVKRGWSMNMLHAHMSYVYVRLHTHIHILKLNTVVLYICTHSRNVR